MEQTQNRILIQKLLKTEKKHFYGESILFKNDQTHLSLSDLHFYQSEFFEGPLQDTDFNNLNFQSCYFSKIHFIDLLINETESSHYLFEDCDFKNAHFKNSDFSGGALDRVSFSDTIFEDCDFVLCEFKDVNFSNIRFISCNFNNSVFEQTEFNDNIVFENSTFKYTEGFDLKTFNFLKHKGAIISLPYEVTVKNLIESCFKNTKPVVMYILTGLMFFCLGWFAKPVMSNIHLILKLEANPLSDILEFFDHSDKKPFFYYNLNLPNHNFTDNMDHWNIILPHPLTKYSGSLTINKSEFSSFPSSICSNKFQGTLIYSIEKKCRFTSNLLNNQAIWLTLDKNTRKLKLSFYYKNGHPRFEVFGTYHEGGKKVLAEIDSRLIFDNKNWIFFSEGIKIPSDIQAVCLRLSQFPDRVIFLDDINLEKTFE